jgi:hypothetical protein
VAGATVAVTLAVVNRTKAPMQVDLEAGCGRGKGVAVVGPGGERVDRTGPDCGLGDACRRRTVRLVLDPGGRVHDARTVTTTVQRWGALCTLAPVEPLKPGEYRIRSASPVWERRGPDRRWEARTAEGRLVVAP